MYGPLREHHAGCGCGRCVRIQPGGRLDDGCACASCADASAAMLDRLYPLDGRPERITIRVDVSQPPWLAKMPAMAQ